MMKINFLNKGQKSVYEKGELLVNKGNDTRGGTYFYQNLSNFSINKEIFIFNSVSKDGGGIYLYNCNSLVIENCVFICNYAKWGGALYLEKCNDIKIRKNTFIFNIALRDGGAVSLSHCMRIGLEYNTYLLNIAFRSYRNVEFHNCI